MLRKTIASTMLVAAAIGLSACPAEDRTAIIDDPATTTLPPPPPDTVMIGVPTDTLIVETPEVTP